MPSSGQRNRGTVDLEFDGSHWPAITHPIDLSAESTHAADCTGTHPGQ
jgi:hypothetical protein